MAATGPRLPPPLQTVLLWRDPAGFLCRCRRELGDAFELRLWPIGRLLVISAPELITQLVTTPSDELLAGEATKRLLPILGERSLPCLDGCAHAERRRTLLPPFAGRALEAHADRIETAVAAELAGWPLERPFRALPRLRRLTLAIACQLIIGRSAPAGLAPRLQAYVAGWAALGAWLPALLPARRALERRQRELDLLLLEQVQRPAAGDHALAALLDADLPPQTILEELRTLLLVAHESTACALAWALERLARNPEALEQLRGGDQRYTDATAREVLRTRPPVLDAVRLATQTLALADGTPIAAGTIVMAAPLLVHHRPDLYPDPERFQPERFLGRRPRAGAYIPFGGGGRRCLGAQMAMLELKALLRALSRLYLTPTRDRPERPRLIGTAVAPANGADIRLAPLRP